MSEELENLFVNKLQLSGKEIKFVIELIDRAKPTEFERDRLNSIADESYNVLEEEKDYTASIAYDSGKDEGYSQGFRDGKISGSGEFR